jgi:hypothetical protein
MKSRKKVLALLIACITFLGAGNSFAQEITGDDPSVLIADAPSIRFDGVLYTNGQIYYSMNNVLSFGAAATNYSGYTTTNDLGGTNGNTIIPSMSFYAFDWVADWGTPRADENMTITTTATSISIDFAGRQFPNNTGAGDRTTVQVTINTDGNGNATYTYVQGGVAVAARDLCVSHGGQIYGCAGQTSTARSILGYVTPNGLRLDSAGTTTEKSNVVSCTPGKYTFLNGGTTAETAKVQSYVYTLLLNGKAVSTLSSDGFKSVASHLFPTIAGNMAGTATLDGATWDLKGMSNYSAQCQVFAIQSGGNTQSLTTGAHDSVALAAAAAEAAKAQMAKDMIAAWASDEAAAKKARNARLAGKP